MTATQSASFSISQCRERKRLGSKESPFWAILSLGTKRSNSVRCAGTSGCFRTGHVGAFVGELYRECGRTGSIVWIHYCLHVNWLDRLEVTSKETILPNSYTCWKQNVTSFFATVNPELKYVSHDEEGRGRQAFHNCAGSEVFSAFSDEKEQRTEASQEKVEIRHMKKFKDVSGPEELKNMVVITVALGRFKRDGMSARYQQDVSEMGCPQDLKRDGMSARFKARWDVRKKPARLKARWDVRKKPARLKARWDVRKT
ncbi:acyl-coa dehydrogenase [Culex quinquefasciatus]|uniref:Acyl-coa dehydrogenase n=1 Tax=Culex quinquefasciatus TaxID=7176 RepID=B0WYF4_CULQU|nr:acyl-coa dehydrogenase [Culex quinquefasciatus]|eukprot:XP_001862426.1 acyl-coa dehydrogenase [Culex quinquefasciatus]